VKKIGEKRGNHIQRSCSVFWVLAASALLVFAALLAPCPVSAQLVTADILGTVTDTTGAVIPDATVTLVNTGTGITQKSKSDKTGEFIFSHVQIGTFKVTIEAKGFKTFTTKGLTPNANDRMRVNAKLEVGSQVETVEVEASAAVQLQTDSSDINATITSNSVSEMPLNGRNVYSLIALQAGTTSSSTSNDPTDERPIQVFSANGQSSIYNNNMIDGMDNNERSLGEVAVSPSIDALQEVKVETNMYSAEYSRTGGGIANMITKSGTNQFHGTLFEFMRNDAFDAYPWEPSGTEKTKAELRQNQFGGSFGGPIFKNKAFFFGDYQGFRQIKGGSSTKWVPTTAEYESAHDYTGSQQIVLNDQWGYGGTATTTTIDPSQVNGLGLAYMMMFPKPTCESCSSYNWSGMQNTVQNSNTYDLRIDYHFDDKNTLFGRYSYNKTDTTEPGVFPKSTILYNDSQTYWDGANINPVGIQNYALDYVHIFSPSTLFEAKASYLRTNMTEDSPNDSYWTAEKTGMPCNDSYCYNVTGVYGLPLTSYSSASAGSYSGTSAPYTGGGDGGYLGYIENSFQYNASLTWNHKSHSVKAGVALIRRQVEAPTSSNTNLSWTPNYTGNALADMIEGYATSISARVEMMTPRYRMWEPSVYVQDDWRVTKSFTLNLGVRYDIYTPWTERQGHLSNFDLNTDLIVSPSLLGDNQASPTGNIKTDFGDISPRIGFAYSLPHSMVIRGGWGMSYFPGNTSGRGEYEMINAPFTWSLNCGASNYATTQCSNSSYAMSDGGYNIAVGIPHSSYDTSLATDTSNYASLGSGVAYMMPNFKPSYLEQMNLQLQQQIKQNIYTVGFVSSLGRRMPTSQNLNQPVSASAAYPMYDSTHSWMKSVSVSEAMSAVNSAWLAGEATYERRLTQGLTANVNFTWARSEGQDSGASECVLSGCPMDDGKGGTVLIGGWADYNYTGSTSHRLAGTLSYNLPFSPSLHGVAGTVLKGWALNATGYWQTGSWTSVTSNVNRSGITGKLLTEYPNKIASAKLSHRTLDQWFNTAAFAEQTEYTLGNARLNTVQGPRSRDLDLGLGKVFSLWEDLKLQFRAEAFNTLNMPNYGTPGVAIGSYNSSTGLANTSNGFGSITSVGNDSRIFQFGLKLIY
jgi:hypothetical protein